MVLLVRIWTAMRYDDTRGIAPGNMRLDGRGFVADLTRTKTTGAGKKVELMEVYVSRQAYIVDKDWLVVGFDLWKAMDTNRDYLLALPNFERDNVVQKPARWVEANALSQALLVTLYVPVQVQVPAEIIRDFGGGWFWRA